MIYLVDSSRPRRVSLLQCSFSVKIQFTGLKLVGRVPHLSPYSLGLFVLFYRRGKWGERSSPTTKTKNIVPFYSTRQLCPDPGCTEERDL